MTHRPVSIRRAVIGDAAAFARVMGHPDVVPGLLQMPYTSEALWQTRLTDTLALGKPDLQLVAELPDSRGQLQVVGTAGLVPFACKLPAPLAQQLRERAASHAGGLNGLVAELLARGLA